MPERLISQKDLGALAGEVLGKGGHFRFQANGGSMRPLIQDGEMVDLVGVDPDQLGRGDIVLYWFAPDVLLLHRVIQAQARGGRRLFVIQGDASCWPDGLVPAERILGRASAVLRRGRWRSLDAFPSPLLARLWMLTIPARRLAARGIGVVKRLTRVRLC